MDIKMTDNLKQLFANEDKCYEHLGTVPIEYVTQIIEGKWRIRILYTLLRHSILRYGELKRSIPNISHKMLSQHLKEFEALGMVKRIEYDEIPPKVEYSLTEKALSLIPAIIGIYDWYAHYIESGGENTFENDI